MKILIAYYSRTGGTEKLAEAIKKEFLDHGHSVDVEKIKPLKEHGFWYWWNIRMVKSDYAIKIPKIKNVSGYDIICIGSPNWTRLSLPVVRYLKEIQGLRYKNIGLFSTTVLWPNLEWYIFSAYLLDFTFSRIINRKGGRIIDSIMTSSLMKDWNVFSKYGEKNIKSFCHKLETPVSSLKKYSLEQREIEDNRFLVVLLSVFLLLSVIFQCFCHLFGFLFINWDRFLFLFLIGFLAYLVMITLLSRRVWVFLGKYIAAFALIFGLTATIFFLTPHLGRAIISGYLLLAIFFSFFRNPKVIIFIITTVALSYIFLLFNYAEPAVLNPGLDILLVSLALIMIGFITRSLEKQYLSLLETQEEIETKRETLEIKVRARTRELEDLSQELEKQVGERTKELQEKIEELERFNKLAIGRELKMVELKKEIKKLKKGVKVSLKLKK